MEMPDVYHALWRHKLLIGALTAVLAAGAWYLTKQETPIYTATSLVRVQQPLSPSDPTGYTQLQATGRLAQEYVIIVKTATIADRIYLALDKQVPLAEIAGGVSGSQVQDLDLLNISAKSPSPALAREIANAAPTALKEWVAASGTLDDQVITVQRASLPIVPTSPSLKLNLLIAIALGLVLNAGLALGLEALRDRAASPEEIEQLTGLPVLTIVPTVSGERPSKAIDALSLEHTPMKKSIADA